MKNVAHFAGSAANPSSRSQMTQLGGEQGGPLVSFPERHIASPHALRGGGATVNPTQRAAFLTRGTPLNSELIVDALRALPEAERLRIVRVFYDVESDNASRHQPPQATPIWREESEQDFDAFQEAVRHARATDVWDRDRDE